MRLTSATRHKRVKLTEGDVFELKVPDGRFGYGIILKRGALTSGGTPYVAIFNPLYEEQPDLTKLYMEQVALAGWTMDALFYHDEWKVIAHGLAKPNLPLPNFKVEMSGEFYVTDVEGKLIGVATASEQALLDYQFSRSPRGFQDAFEALHGFREWQVSYEQLTPSYAKARITRPPP